MSGLISLLVRDDVIDVSEIEVAIDRQVQAGGTMDTALLELDLVPENTLLSYLAASQGVAPVEREELDRIPLAVLAYVPRELADTHQMVPFARDGQRLEVAFFAVPPDEVLDHLRFELECEVSPRVTLQIRIAEGLQRYYDVTCSTRETSLLAELTSRDPGEPVSVDQEGVISTPLPISSAGTMREDSKVTPDEAFIRSEEQRRAFNSRVGRARSSEDWIQATLDYGRRLVERLVIFVRQSEAAVVVADGGRRAGTLAAAQFALPLDMPSALRRAGETRDVQLLQRENALDALLIEELGLDPEGCGHVFPCGLGEEADLWIVLGGANSDEANEALDAFRSIAEPLAEASTQLPFSLARTPEYAFQTSSGDIEAVRETLFGLATTPFNPRLLPEPTPWPNVMEERGPGVTTLVPPQILEVALPAAASAPPSAMPPSGADVGETDFPPPVGRGEGGGRGIANLDRWVHRLLESSPWTVDEIIEEVAGYEDVAMVVLEGQFPGPTWSGPQAGIYPSAEELSAASRFYARIGESAMPTLIKLLESTDTQARVASLIVAAELWEEELIPHLCRRIFDVDAEVRGLAISMLRQRETAGAGWNRALTGLRGAASAPRPDSELRSVAIWALGELRDVVSIQMLIELLGDLDEKVSEASSGALVKLTGHDFGSDGGAWWSWYETFRHQHRVEWLIEGLNAAREVTREVAARELERLTEHYVGYHPGLPAPERVACQQRYFGWWTREGKAKYTAEPA